MRSSIKDSIQEVLINSTSIDQFKADLKVKGIDVVIRQNDDGRIYGVTFIDHENRIAFNGSRLGKAFSANAFHERFQNNAELDIEAGDSKMVNHKRVTETNESLNPSASDHQNQSDNKESLISDIFKILSNNHGYRDDYYYAGSGKRKRKKRRRFGRQD